MAFLGFTGSMAYGAFYPALAETLPKAIRGRAFATIYATAIAVFGGTTQLIITWLIQATGSAMSPGWYLFAGNIVALAAMVLMLETAPVRLEAALTVKTA